jgi:hypothetical protein
MTCTGSNTLVLEKAELTELSQSKQTRIVRADEKLTAFAELESAIRAVSQING